MARIHEAITTPAGWVVDVYQGKQDGEEVYLAVANFTGHFRAGASTVGGEDAMVQLDRVITALGEDPVTTEYDTRDLQARYDQLRIDYDDLEEKLDSEWSDVVQDKDDEIDELAERVLDLEEELAAIDDIADYRPDFEDAEAMLADCEAEVADLREEISELESDLANAEASTAELAYEVNPEYLW
jgi:chromosome segregation ATPase